MATVRRSSTDHHHQNHRTAPEVTVVMVPLPAQGHLNQLLQLSRLIAAYDIPIHFVSTAAHNRQAKRRIHGWDPLAASNLHFHDFPIPEFISPPINPNAANKFPSHLQPLFDAAAHLRQPLTKLLHFLSNYTCHSPNALTTGDAIGFAIEDLICPRSTHRIVVIHDSLMSSTVQDVVTIPNVESYIFHSVSAFSMFWFFMENPENPFEFDDKLLQEQEQIPSLEDCFTTEFMEFIISEDKYNSLSSGFLYNACREIEGKYINLIEKKSENENKKHWAIGPFNPVELIEKNSDKLSSRHECLKWLDKQESKSVIFVSFGTTTSLHDEQIKELANGLEESELKFIWVLRDADSGDSNTDETRKGELGFEGRIKERGIIVRDWAPQLEILSHPSTGGFLSHCGWNSCMESISMGVPIAAWPMHSDQPRNTFLITEVLKIGVVVKEWAQRDKTVSSSTISMALKRLMRSEEGEEIRRRAEELGGAVKRALAEGGVSRLEMDSFVTHISR
ncbi:hypothetical protein BUALT_Bualt12G0019900 [Buddleja alternifolia]|uniref:Glycosyltransferase n=1 Tax=Buddleja alternifolia TaxID=168488 RepID=A0AAV6WWE2_9LAMI|nr:hypothetical protein BUALT_Bualt12G0019900 [Buddleja alternifolia]